MLAVDEIDAGDALALATRFERQWAYRGAQALFWKPPLLDGAQIHDAYLPSSVAHPFERRGFLRVDGRTNGEPLSLVITQIADDRARRIRDTRFIRTQLRACRARTMLFVRVSAARFHLDDLHFACVSQMRTGSSRIYAREVGVLADEELEVSPSIGHALVLRCDRSRS